MEDGTTEYPNNQVNESFAIDFKNSQFSLFDPDEQSSLDLNDTSTDWSKYRLYKNLLNNRYTHNLTSTSPSIFYRQLILKAEKPEECDDPSSDKYSCTSNSRLHVISRVQWREPLLAGDETAPTSDLIGTVVMETYLYDYLGRDGY
jgi:hypothetical protein